MKRNLQSLWSPARVLLVFLSLGKQMCVAAFPEGWQNRAVSDQGRWILSMRSRRGPQVELWDLQGEPWGSTTSVPTCHTAGLTETWERVMQWSHLHPSPWATRAVHSFTAQDRCPEGGCHFSPSSGTSLVAGWGEVHWEQGRGCCSGCHPVAELPPWKGAPALPGTPSLCASSMGSLGPFFILNKSCFPNHQQSWHRVHRDAGWAVGAF